MTVFILVAGAFTGPHVWRDTAARLTADGAEVRTVALTGLGGRPGDPGETVDLETHVADVLAVIDAVAAEAGREIVLVGHDYGIHPVLGAADRRAGAIARIVHLDAGMPRDGVPALAAVPDQLLRDEVVERAAGGGSGVPEASCRPRPGTGGPAGGAPRASPTRRSTGSPPSRRRSRWARCSSRCGSPERWPRCP